METTGFLSAENSRQPIVLALYMDTICRVRGLRIYYPESGRIDDQVPVTPGSSYWNVDLVPKEGAHNGCKFVWKAGNNLIKCPRFIQENEDPPIRYRRDGSGGWVLGEHADGRLRIISINGGVKDVAQDVALAFHRKAGLANAREWEGKLLPPVDYSFPKIAPPLSPAASALIDEYAANAEARDPQRVGSQVLVTPVSWEGNFNRAYKKMRATILPPAGKYELFSHNSPGVGDVVYFRTASGLVTRADGFIRYGFEDYGREGSPPTEEELDAVVTAVADNFERQMADPARFILYQEAAVVNRVAECDAHNGPARELIAAEDAARELQELQECKEDARQAQLEYEARIAEIEDALRTDKTIDVQYNEHRYSGKNPVLDLFRKYRIDVPLRTQGWINSTLCEITPTGSRRLGTVNGKKTRSSETFLDKLEELRITIKNNPSTQTPPAKDAQGEVLSGDADSDLDASDTDLDALFSPPTFLDRIAQALYEASQKKRPNDPRFKARWEECDERTVSKNKEQARSLFDAVTDMGYSVLRPAEARDANFTLVDSIPPHILDEFGRGEHDRWMAKKIRDGYVWGAVNDDEKKTSSTIVPYDDLPQSENDKDYAQLFKFIEAAKTIGRALYTLNSTDTSISIPTSAETLSDASSSPDNLSTLAAPQNASSAKTERLKSLSDELKAASDAYYNLNDSPLSDHEYDEKLDELRALEAELGISADTAPSATPPVGAPVSGGKLSKITHPERLLSLDKTKDIEVLSGLFASHPDAGDAILAWKMDGLTIEAYYENGKFIRAATRGDGKIGEDVTHSAKYFIGLPQTISYNGSLRVRGEAVVSFPAFDRINAELPAGHEPYKNPRNLASGLVRRESTSGSNGVEFHAFAVNGAPQAQFYSELLVFLKVQGFTPVQYYLCNPSTLPAYIDKFKESVKTYDRPTDGLVLTINSITVQEELGATGHHPRWSMAFKWADEQQKTILRGVEWSASRTGALTPVALFDPVELEGTTVKRASVHNLSMLRHLQLGIGDELLIYKANMIIPQIAQNLTRSDSVQPPQNCPICDGPVSIRKDGNSEFVVCTNPDCAAKNVGSLVHFVKREAANIEGVSEKSIEDLVLNGFIRKPVDFYNVKSQPAIAELPGWGKSSYNNLVYAVDNSRNINLANFIYALGIKNVGRSASDALARHFKSLDAFLSASEQDLSKVEGVGKLMVVDILSYLSANRDDVTELAREFTITNPGAPNTGLYAATTGGVPAGVTGILEGLTFCITGAVEFPGKRTALQSYISSLGGRNASSVTKNVDYLITNTPNSGSSKNKAALALGCRVISEATFMRMAQGL